MRDEARTWWASVTGGGAYVHAVVLGPRKCGKTSYFRRLSEEPASRVRLWTLPRLTRAGTPEEVWSDLWRLLGIPEPRGEDGSDPGGILDAYCGTLDEGPIVVIDDWDGAVDGRGTEVSDACYEVLDALARHCVGQDAVQTKTATLGLVLLTSLPDAADLEYFARAVHRQTFERLSNLITRLFRSERFPFLSRAGSEQVLTGSGVPAGIAGEIAAACGGWLWLLTEAAGLFNEAGRWDAETRTRLREQRLPPLLEESLFKHLDARPEVRASGRAPLVYLGAELKAGRAPAAFGLPHLFDDEKILPPLIGELLNRTFLLVDTESLRMPYQRHAKVSPHSYPDGLEPFLQATLGPWLTGLIRDHGVRDDDATLIGRNAARIDATVGAALPGRRVALPRGLQDKSRGAGDSSDDQLLIASLIQQAERFPLAQFIVVSADADAPLIFSRVDIARRLMVITPWKASARLDGVVPGENIIEHSLRAPRPPHVPDRTANAARARP